MMKFFKSHGDDNDNKEINEDNNCNINKDDLKEANNDDDNNKNLIKKEKKIHLFCKDDVNNKNPNIEIKENLNLYKDYNKQTTFKTEKQSNNRSKFENTNKKDAFFILNEK